MRWYIVCAIWYMGVNTAKWLEMDCVGNGIATFSVLRRMMLHEDREIQPYDNDAAKWV